MPDEKRDNVDTSPLRLRALSRWENEGGAPRHSAQDDVNHDEKVPEAPELTNAELVQLRIRVIALENLMIALLAETSDREIDLAREMATYISPRPGYTQHPLTVHAAAQMIDLIERANQFRNSPPSSTPYKRTSVFDEHTLPDGLRREHRTKPDVWGVIRVLDGRVRYQVLEPASETILEPGHPGVIRPDEPHLVEPLGPMRMQIEFYHEPPNL
jgi:tellurite resistance-related uncharacterized protein